jgi:hypothetical protein
MCVFSSKGTVFPPGTENRLHDFIELLATAISNYDARAELRMLADEQAALRRVATLVAEGTSVENLCAAVWEEVGRLLDVPASVWTATRRTRAQPRCRPGATSTAGSGGPGRWQPLAT